MIDDFVGGEAAEIDDSQTVEPIEPQEGLEPAAVEDSETEENNAEGEKVRKKKLGGYQRKLTRLEQENAELLRELEAVKPKAAAVSTEEPNLADYKDWNAWNEAKIDWKVEKKLEAREKAAEERKVKEEQAKVITTWKQRVDSLIDSDEEFEDYYEITAKYNKPDSFVHPTIREALDELGESGPELAHYLARNGLIEEFNKMNSRKVSSEIDKILPLLRNQQKAPVKVSKSPAPIRPVSGSAKSVVALKDMDTEAFIAERMKRRR